MKFGKQLEARQLEFLEHNGHFIDYKSLKKIIKQLSYPIPNNNDSTKELFEGKRNSNQNLLSANLFIDSNDDDLIISKRLQENQSTFFFKLERELENVNNYYLSKENELNIKFKILQNKFDNFIKTERNTTNNTFVYKNISSALKKFHKDLVDLQQYVELNKTGFSKVLKKWDKRSSSHQKEFYFATVVLVQPIFTHNDISSLLEKVLSMINTLENQKDLQSFNEDLKEFKLDNSNSNTNLTNHSILLESNNFDEDDDINCRSSTWYAELLNILKLSDLTKLEQMINNFHSKKIQAYIETLKSSINFDCKLLKLQEIITSIFILLIDSPINDDALKCFYLKFKPLIILTYYNKSEVFSNRNIFHEAARCIDSSRSFIIKEILLNSEIPKKELENMLNTQDFNSRTALHYASELGKEDVTKLILESNLYCKIDLLDFSSKTPLILAIENNNNNIVKILLNYNQQYNNNRSNSHISLSFIPQFIPLNVACYNNNFASAKMLLEQSDDTDLSTLYDAHGLTPLHIVAKIGGDPKLIDLLVKYGANPNGIDKFSKWTPIFYAVQEGHGNSVQALLDNGASSDILDEEKRCPLFYAMWEGYADILNILPKKANLQIQKSSLDSIDLSDDCDIIEMPSLELPPPIIPSRKYGHSFLEKKILVKLLLSSGSNPIQLFNTQNSEFIQPGRITITSNASGSYPKNIVLPIEERKKEEISFHVPSLTNFLIEFEVFSKFGNKFIGKAVVARSSLQLGYDGWTSLSVTILDSHLVSIGSVTFDLNVILPRTGESLNITEYDTYWKATFVENKKKSETHILPSSSLKEKYMKLNLFILNDGCIVCAPRTTIDVSGSKFFLNDLTKTDVTNLLGTNITIPPDFSCSDEIEEYLSNRIIIFENLLPKIPYDVQLNLQVHYPTILEMRNIPIKINPNISCNTFIDDILDIVFRHERVLKNDSIPMRSILFSSTNLQVCSILNWKQPNFPALYEFNAIKLKDGKFYRDTPNSLLDLAINPFFPGFVDNKSSCIREIVQSVSDNNLLGIIIPSDLLKLSCKLLTAITNSGLLVLSSGEENPALAVNGISLESSLVFESDDNIEFP